MIETMAGLFLCRLLMEVGLSSFAPGVCFGGDTSAVGLNAIVVAMLGAAVGLTVGFRSGAGSSTALIIVVLSVLGVGSAAIVHFIDY